MDVASILFITECNTSTQITRKYVHTIQNFSDIGSRGSNVKNLPKEWWDGPRWLAYSEHCSEQNKITPTKKLEKESKIIIEVMCTATKKSVEID